MYEIKRKQRNKQTKKKIIRTAIIERQRIPLFPEQNRIILRENPQCRVSRARSLFI